MALLDDDELKHLEQTTNMTVHLGQLHVAKVDLIKHNDTITDLTDKMTGFMNEAVATGTSILSMISSFGSVTKAPKKKFYTNSQQFESSDDDEDGGGGSGDESGFMQSAHRQGGAPTSTKRKRVDDEDKQVNTSTWPGGASAAAVAAAVAEAPSVPKGLFRFSPARK